MSISTKETVIGSLKIAGAISAYLIGAGFSSGQELLQYYVSYGLYGLGAALIACITLIFMAVSLLTLGKRENIQNPHQVFKYYCGAKVGSVFEFVAFSYLIVQVIVFFTGAGATIAENFNVSPFIGSSIMGVAVILTSLLGLSRLANIMGGTGILLIIIVVTITVIFLFRDPANLAFANYETVKTMNILQPSGSWILSGFLYETFNLLGLAAFLPLLGARSKSQKINIIGGTLGPILIIIAISLVTLAFLTDITNIGNKLVPMLYIANHISPFIGSIFSIVILMAIYSGASPMFWNFCSRIVPENSSKFKPFVAGLGILSIILGALLPFDKAINVFYLTYGYLGTAFLAFLIYKQFKNIKDKQNKAV